METGEFQDLVAKFDVSPIKAKCFKITEYGEIGKIIEKGNNQEWTMKVINRPEWETIMEREYPILKSLTHKNLMKLYATYSSPSKMFFLMTSVLPMDLATYCEQYQGFRPVVVKFYTFELLSALVYLRNCGIVHRNVHAGNCFFSYDFHLKLGEFGNCYPLKKVEERSAPHSYLKPFEGDNQYVAREVWDGSRLSYSTDCWGLAVVISYLHYGTWIAKRIPGEEPRTYYPRVLSGISEPLGKKDKWNPLLKDLITKLINSPNYIRLGEQDITEVSYHAYFEGYRWSRDTKPPTFIENVKNPILSLFPDETHHGPAQFVKNLSRGHLTMPSDMEETVRVTDRPVDIQWDHFEALPAGAGVEDWEEEDDEEWEAMVAAGRPRSHNITNEDRMDFVEDHF